jgi:4-hydroxyproline epimerase
MATRGLDTMTDVQISTVDGHVAGGAVRLVVAGAPAVVADSLADRSQALVEALGFAAAGLGREPRGHTGTTVVLLAEPDRAAADAGMIFLHDGGLVPLCGQALIGATALALDRRLVVPRQPGSVELDTLAGPVRARWTVARGRAARVAYAGPPSSVLRPNYPMAIGRRELRADLVWTGAELVAILDAEAAGVPLVAARALEVQQAGRQVIAHLDDVVRVPNPLTGSIVSVATAVFIGASPEQGADVRSGSVHRDGAVDRSPGGGATVAIATVLTAMGLLVPGGTMIHQGLAGTSLRAEVTEIGEQDGVAMVTVEVEGECWPTGDHTFTFHPDDPLIEGYTWT